jgi:hypothetical protein
MRRSRAVRHTFDQLAKQIGCKALAPCGKTVAHEEIAVDALLADLRHDPDPSRDAERARLGLLGRIAAILCLIEVFSTAPDEDEILGCAAKLIAFRSKLRREVRQNRRTNARRKVFVKPFCWIIVAGRPSAVLDGPGITQSPDWPKGVYFFATAMFRTGIIVASELAEERSTLLVRLMAGGRLLPQALHELAALPKDALEHAVANEILLSLRLALSKKRSRTVAEQEFIVTTRSLVEELRNEGRIEGLNEGRIEGLNEGRIEGLNEGRIEEAHAALYAVLEQRKLVPTREERARINACKDVDTLRRWHVQAVVAQNVAEALTIPRRKAPRPSRRKSSARQSSAV